MMRRRNFLQLLGISVVAPVVVVRAVEAVVEFEPSDADLNASRTEYNKRFLDAARPNLVHERFGVVSTPMGPGHSWVRQRFVGSGGR